MPSAAGYWMVGHSYETAGCLCQSPPLSMIRVTDSPVNLLNDWQEADCPHGWSHHDKACYRCVYGIMWNDILKVKRIEKEITGVIFR